MVTYLTGSTPRSIVVKDFNSDGKLDLAVGNQGSATVSILLGYGNGTFRTQTTYATDSSPMSIFTADLNNDTRGDLLLAAFNTGTISVLLANDSSGTFAAQRSYLIGSGARTYGAVAGDVNNDGRPDLVACNQANNSFSVFLGNGSGTFGAERRYLTGTTDNPQALVLTDFNGDNKLDIAMANVGSNSLGIYLGNGNGTFRSVVTYGGTSSPAAITVADFNGDGKLDVVLGNGGSNSVSVYLGYGNGTFANQTRYTAANTVYGVAIGDLNRDGVQDIVTANFAANSTSLLLGYGDGTFAAPRQIALGDFNGDNRTDLAVANSVAGNIGILLNTC